MLKIPRIMGLRMGGKEGKKMFVEKILGMEILV